MSALHYDAAQLRLTEQAPELLAACQLLLKSAPPHICHRNAKEREAYRRIYQAVERATKEP